MDKETIARNIVRLRKIKKINQQDLAQKAGITKSALLNIEKAKTDPRSSTLLNIARALEVKVPALFAELPSFSSVRFRIAKTSTARERKAREQELIDVAIWLKNYRELEEALCEKQDFLLEGKTYQHPKEAAHEVRPVLSLDTKEPIFNIAGLCEKAGIKLYFTKSTIKKYFGMSVAKEDGGPAIAINVSKEISIERQIFTVAHELGHLVLHKGSYNLDMIDEDENEEKEADTFASYFLMPVEGFEREWREARGLGLVDRVFNVKRIFKVSYLTVLRRLIETRRAQNDLYKNFAYLYTTQNKGNLKDHYEPASLKEPEGFLTFDFMESRLHRLVRTACEKEIISFNRAAEILGISIEEMRSLSKSWKME